MENDELIAKVKSLTSEQKKVLSSYIDDELLNNGGGIKDNESLAEEISSYEITNPKTFKSELKDKNIDAFIEQWQGFLKDENIDTDQAKNDYFLDKHS